MLDRSPSKEQEFKEGGLGRAIADQLTCHSSRLRPGLTHERPDPVNGGTHDLGKECAGAGEQLANLLVGVQALNQVVRHDWHEASEPEPLGLREICPG